MESGESSGAALRRVALIKLQLSIPNLDNPPVLPKIFLCQL